jgi:cell division protein FtsQ
MRIFKKILVLVGWLCLACFVGFTIYFAYAQMEAVRCQSIVVFINPNSPRFMDEDAITSMIEKSGEPIIGHRLSSINIEQLEAKLTTFATLNNVEVFRKIDARGWSFKGKLVINVDERTPILRIKNATEDYYLDREGVKIPVSGKYAERIMIATGTIPDEEVKRSLLKMTDFVNKDEFWRAQIEQVLIQPNGELLLLPQVGDYLIEFGKPEDYELKFRNLKAVYQQGFKNFGWNKYKAISVKFQNQVICTKK